MLRGEPAPTSDGLQVRDYLYVEDIALALYHIMGSDVNGSVNVASGLPVTLRQIIETIGEVVGRPELLRIGEIPRAVGDTEMVVADISKLAAAGFSPEFSLEEGLGATVEYWSQRLGLPYDNSKYLSDSTQIGKN